MNHSNYICLAQVQPFMFGCINKRQSFRMKGMGKYVLEFIIISIA